MVCVELSAALNPSSTPDSDAVQGTAGLGGGGGGAGALPSELHEELREQMVVLETCCSRLMLTA